MSNSTLSAHIAPGHDVLFNLIKSIPQTLKYQPGTIVAEGDFVIVHGRFSGFGAPVNWIAADIVRIEAGILAEHWDVIRDEATEEQSKSGAPMFGAHVRNYIPDLRWKKNKSRRVGLPMTTPPIIRAALASNWSALCQAKWLRFLPSGIGSCCGSGSAAVFLRARATLRSHCAKPSQTRSFTEIMRVPESRSMFVAAVKLRKSQIAVKDEGRGFDINTMANPTAP